MRGLIWYAVGSSGKLSGKKLDNFDDKISFQNIAMNIFLLIQLNAKVASNSVADLILCGDSAAATNVPLSGGPMSLTVLLLNLRLNQQNNNLKFNNKTVKLICIKCLKSDDKVMTLRY